MRFSCFVYILVLVSAFVSCDDSSSNDKTPPKVVEVKTPQDGDILYLTRDDNRFVASFTDDEGISSYMVKIETSKPNENEDSLYMKYRKGWSPTIYLAKEVSADHNITLGDRQQHDSIKTSTYPIIPGDYKFKVYCMDMAGNIDSLIRDVKVLYPPKTEEPEEENQ